MSISAIIGMVLVLGFVFGGFVFFVMMARRK